jgi:hypothetical protein
MGLKLTKNLISQNLFRNYLIFTSKNKSEIKRQIFAFELNLIVFLKTKWEIFNRNSNFKVWWSNFLYSEGV